MRVQIFIRNWCQNVSAELEGFVHDLMTGTFKRKCLRVFSLALMLAALSLFLAPPAHADRVKDLASLASVRANQLLGYGLVVGLEGTGDGADLSVTASSMKAILGRLGVNIDGSMGDFDRAASGKLDVKNVAAVMVTAELPGFSKPGQRIDVNVSAIGKAKSLRGGNLILTSLRGVDGQVYAPCARPADCNRCA